MLIHLPFLPSVIISVLHLLKLGMERRGKKLLAGNAWPSDGDGTGARGERGAGISVGGREGKKLLQV